MVSLRIGEDSGSLRTRDLAKIRIRDLASPKIRDLAKIRIKDLVKTANKTTTFLVLDFNNKQT